MSKTQILYFIQLTSNIVIIEINVFFKRISKSRCVNLYENNLQSWHDRNSSNESTTYPQYDLKQNVKV